jgi:hypothetical protein
MLSAQALEAGWAQLFRQGYGPPFLLAVLENIALIFAQSSAFHETVQFGGIVPLHEALDAFQLGKEHFLVVGFFLGEVFEQCFGGAVGRFVPPASDRVFGPVLPGDGKFQHCSGIFQFHSLHLHIQIVHQMQLAAGNSSAKISRILASWFSSYCPID